MHAGGVRFYGIGLGFKGAGFRVFLPLQQQPGSDECVEDEGARLCFQGGRADSKDLAVTDPRVWNIKQSGVSNSTWIS